LKQKRERNKKTLQRPRSLRAHDKVLDAASELFATHGIDATSIDSIAARSGVSKATIYKHWADKKALCLEVLIRVHGLHREAPQFDSGDLLQDLIDFLNYQQEEAPSELRERLVPHLVAYAARDKDFAKTWRARVMEPSRAQALALLQRGIATGVFPPDLDLTLGMAMLIGPMVFRHFYRTIGPIPDNLAEGVAKAFWRAFAVSAT
jgi:AcrR family transcriptional regulator